jgi:hypothetical protein
VASLRRYLPEPWVRRVCLLGGLHTPEELRLDAAGAIVCDPGRAAEIAQTVAASLGQIESQSLARTKRGIAGVS